MIRLTLTHFLFFSEHGYCPFPLQLLHRFVQFPILSHHWLLKLIDYLTTSCFANWTDVDLLSVNLVIYFIVDFVHLSVGRLGYFVLNCSFQFCHNFVLTLIATCEGSV